MEKVNCTIIGAGIIGLSTAYELSKTGQDIIVVEKHKFFGQETSSRNSEVIHAGIYYPKDSLKSRLCIEGKKLLYDICGKQNIPHKKLGKILISNDQEGTLKLQEIKNNADECGLSNLRFLTKNELKKMEPNIEAIEALLCPDTGIIDSHQLMKFFYDHSKENNVEFAFGIEVIGIKKFNSYYEITVKEPRGELFSFQTEAIINAAGFFSDKIAELAGMDIEKLRYKIHMCKGQYFRISAPERFNVSHLIYPPPSSFDLGIHITPDLAGGLRLGPDAEFVDAASYEININDKEKFYTSVKRFLKGLFSNDLSPDTAGIRAKLQGPNDPFRDFVISNEAEKGFPNFINLVGIESPGLTSCLSIAEVVKKML